MEDGELRDGVEEIEEEKGLKRFVTISLSSKV